MENEGYPCCSSSMIRTATVFKVKIAPCSTSSRTPPSSPLVIRIDPVMEDMLAPDLRTLTVTSTRSERSHLLFEIRLLQERNKGKRFVFVKTAEGETHRHCSELHSWSGSIGACSGVPST